MMHLKTLLYLSLPTAVLASPTCYYPDGSVAANYTSCASDDSVSHCCSKESICLTNGYCMAAVNTYSMTRGTCTDKSWPSDTCKNPCEYGTRLPSCPYRIQSNSCSILYGFHRLHSSSLQQHRRGSLLLRQLDHPYFVHQPRLLQ